MEQYVLILLPPLPSKTTSNYERRELTVRPIQRLTRESWCTNLQKKPLNRCQQVQVPYKRLIQDENETDKRTSNN